MASVSARSRVVYSAVCVDVQQQDTHTEHTWVSAASIQPTFGCTPDQFSIGMQMNGTKSCTTMEPYADLCLGHRELAGLNVEHQCSRGLTSQRKCNLCSQCHMTAVRCGLTSVMNTFSSFNTRDNWLSLLTDQTHDQDGGNGIAETWLPELRRWMDMM